MNEQEYDRTDSGLHVPKSALPKMNKRELLKSEKDKIDQSKDNFFWAVWVFLSATTALFGFQHLPEIFAPMLEFLPFEPAGIYRAAQWCGAIMGLLFLDVGYIRWGHIRLHASETAKQIQIATTAEYFAFIGSVYFSAAVIASAFVTLLPPNFIRGLQVGGAIIFIMSAVVTMVCRFLFDRYSTESIAQADYAKNKGDETTEILDIYNKAKTDALKDAKARMKNLLPDISEQMATELATQIKGEMKSQFRPTPPTPQPKQTAPKVSRSH